MAKELGMSWPACWMRFVVNRIAVLTSAKHIPNRRLRHSNSNHLILGVVLLHKMNHYQRPEAIIYSLLFSSVYIRVHPWFKFYPWLVVFLCFLCASA